LRPNPHRIASETPAIPQPQHPAAHTDFSHPTRRDGKRWASCRVPLVAAVTTLGTCGHPAGTSSAAVPRTERQLTHSRESTLRVLDHDVVASYARNLKELLGRSKAERFLDRQNSVGREVHNLQPRPVVRGSSLPRWWCNPNCNPTLRNRRCRVDTGPCDEWEISLQGNTIRHSAAPANTEPSELITRRSLVQIPPPLRKRTPEESGVLCVGGLRGSLRESGDIKRVCLIGGWLEEWVVPNGALASRHCTSPKPLASVPACADAPGTSG